MDPNAADNWQNNARRLEGRRIDVGAGAKSLTGAVVGGLIAAAALGMVFGVRHYRPDVGMNRERADMTEHDEDRNTGEQPRAYAPRFHPAKR